MLTKQQLDLLREKLDKTLIDIKEELGEVEDEKGEVKVTDFGGDVESTEDLPEEADEAEELSTNIAISSGLKDRLENVQEALRKMDKETYGKCENCGKDISFELLEVNPESRHCENCNKKSL